MKVSKVIIGILLISVITTGAAFAQALTSVTYRQEGIASWYGNEFNGRPTASGEIFDSNQFTAAHPNLPFGTILRVTNIHNGKWVDVRVNDRGPFVAARIIDLSRAAAEALDMIVTGTAPVIIESTASVVSQTPAPVPTPQVTYQPAPTAPSPAPQVVNQPAPTVPAPQPQPQPQIPSEYTVPSATTPAGNIAENWLVQNTTQTANIIGGIPQLGTGKHYRLQVGAYRIPRNAVETFDKLKGVGLSPAYEVEGEIYRVVLANLNPEDVLFAAERLYTAGFEEALIREER